MVSKRALITGITGQDGSYLAELLLSKGYEVYGLARRSSQPNTQYVPASVNLIYGDLLDEPSLHAAVRLSQPDEVYNLAAQTFVGGSWAYPAYTSEVTGLGALHLLEAVRECHPSAKFYQASSSEMFGNQSGALNENAPFKPRSPYGTAKLFAHHITINYRESFGLFACAGILFNHESPRRGNEFVTKKIINQAKEIQRGERTAFSLGAINPTRDWGHARDYVEAMWLMLQQPEPKEYVIGRGVSHSVEDFMRLTAKEANVEYAYVLDPRFNRPAEINQLTADWSLAKQELGWEPKIDLQGLIKEMLQ